MDRDPYVRFPGAPKVGDRHHVKFSIDTCGYLSTGWRGYRAGTRTLGIRSRLHEGSGIVTINAVRANSPGGSKVFFEGTLRTDRGDRIHIAGGPEGKFFGPMDFCVPG